MTFERRHDRKLLHCVKKLCLTYYPSTTTSCQTLQSFCWCYKKPTMSYILIFTVPFFWAQTGVDQCMYVKQQTNISKSRKFPQNELKQSQSCSLCGLRKVANVYFCCKSTHVNGHENEACGLEKVWSVGPAQQSSVVLSGEFLLLTSIYGSLCLWIAHFVCQTISNTDSCEHHMITTSLPTHTLTANTIHI